MTTSTSVTGIAPLIRSLIATLTADGYAFNPLTTSFEAYLATVLEGLVGGSNLVNTRSVAGLFADISSAHGGSGDEFTVGIVQCTANIIDGTSLSTAGQSIGLLLALTKAS